MAEEKKRRLQNACDECRRRKIRCDSANAPGNICTNCLSLSIACTHQAQRKRRGPQIRPDNDCRALVNAILSSSRPYVPPDDPEAVKEILVKLANHARSLDRQLSELALAIRLDVQSIPDSPDASFAEQRKQSEGEDSIDSLTQELRNMSVTHLYPRHFGKSSNYMLVQSAMESRRDVLGDSGFLLAVFTKHRRPEFWRPHSWQAKPETQEPPLVFPEDDLLYDLVSLYFTSVNSVFPLLHRPTFERAIAVGLHRCNRSFGAAVLAVCALGARQSNDARNLADDTASEHSLGWKWFSQVPLMRESFTEPPSLYDLQLLSLCVIYLQTTSTPETAWTLVGVGIRCAQEMGTHRKHPQPANTIEAELLKRAFWFFISVDLFFSTFMGRPRAMTSDDFDADLPIECDDEYWENSGLQQAPVQPPGKPSVITFFVTLLRLLDIASFAQRTLYSVRKSELWTGMGVFGIDWKRKAVAELDSALNKFADTIPEHLKWDPENPDPIFFQQSAMLHTLYRWVQIHVHRPFIPRPGQEPVLPLPSLEICSNAARKLIHIIERLQTRTSREIVILELAPYILSPLFASTLILLLGIWRPKAGSTSTLDSSKEMADVYRSLKLIQNYESRYSSAGRVFDILSAVITVGQLPRASQKRARNLGDSETQTSVPSNLQKALEEVHDTLHSQEPAAGPSVETPDPPFSGPPPGGFLSAFDVSGTLNTTVPLQSQTDFLVHEMGLPAGEDDISLFENLNNLASSQFMLQTQLGDPTNPNSMWNAPPVWSESTGFTQEDWDSLMASVDSIVAEGGEYGMF